MALKKKKTLTMCFNITPSGFEIRMTPEKLLDDSLLKHGC